MNNTQWFSGIKDPNVLPFIGNQLPETHVSTSYILIENESPLGVDKYGYGDSSLIKGYSTKIPYKNGSLKVKVNQEEISVTETGSASFSLSGIHKGYFTVDYVPNDIDIFLGDFANYELLNVTTNANIRYVDISTQMIEQMRYALNAIEEYRSLQQTRWCGGFYSDEFALANYDIDNDKFYSNLKNYVTEITPQMFYELLNSISEISTRTGIQLADSYDQTKIYSKLGLEYGLIEYIRSRINELESKV